ncbi:hypothetical protein [Aurantiacibacter poecillastricola]|uniref:hypothetical protein n=1 Tax=Aurantiacibacter poecillastricola TaxID=3064385 RepID=UPI00273F3293|nr:hypothetical protein [Aurantiacibacter sp. 219JJ12-13]MDP5263376.1 hypothetical protein [Aurantiacibacter sp. 219JJ12-13]
MGIDDREYMKERYRRRGGAVGIPIWRDRHARMEYDEADMVAGRYRAQAGSMLRLGPTSSATGSRKNMLAAAALGFAAIVVKSLGKRDSVPDRARFSFRVAGGRPNLRGKTITYRECALRSTFFCQSSKPRILGSQQWMTGTGEICTITGLAA